MLTDLRDAWRQIRRHPLISAGVLGIIGMAVATNAVLFSIVDGLLLKPLPFRDSDRVVSLRWSIATAQRLSPVERTRLREVVEQTLLLTDRAVDGPAGLFDDEDELAIASSAVSSNLFELLGVRPLIGSGVPPDGAANDPTPIVVGHALWRNHFGADPSVVGRRTTLQGRSVVVVGVMPPGFDFPRGTNVWSPAGRFQRESLPSVARLAKRATVAQLRRALAPIEVRPLSDAVRPEGALTLLFLLAGSGLLLLIAWTQVAALQLARFPGRLREVGVRVALGASRSRLVRLFAMEGLILSVAALGMGWLLALALTGAVTALLPAEMLRGQHIVADIRVFLFAFGLSFVGVAVCAVAPAVWLIRQPAANSLRGEVVVGNGRPLGSRLRQVLLTGQLAVTALLLYMAGLATRSFIAVDHVDLGFDPAGLYVISVPLTGLGDAPAAATVRRQQQIFSVLDAVRRLPGVAGAAGATTYPLRAGGYRGGLSLPRVQAWTPISVRMNYVTPDYFRVLRLPLLAGAGPSGIEPRREAVANDTLGRALAVHGPVIGQQIAIGAFFGEIVGIVGDCVNDRPDGRPEPQIYLANPMGVSLVVARVGDPAALAGVRSVVDRLAYPHRGSVVRAIEDDRRRSIGDYRARMLLLLVLAIVGLTVALLGVAGGLYHEIRHQTRAIAIRAALGAQPHDIRGGVLRKVLGWAWMAAIAGSVAGAVVGRVGRALLFNVNGFDGVTLMAVCGVLTAVALASSYPAVRQALAVDPATALRHE